MEKITLTRTQLDKLNKISQGFPEIEYFDVVSTNDSSTFVVFDYLDREDTTIEITDMENS